ncbi:dUTP diphosphatase [Leucobacter chironomi]|uniref:dUTP diphosphatase n=1 Tax=Leucobacter chironomi TaxID=491918 RepID=UPI00040898B2|nr:dUTP diphosphatase [Leucobacter chironomi]
MTDVVEIPIRAEIPPRYAHADDAGADLFASEPVVLQPGERALIGTGVAIALPEGYAAFVVPRSGLAAKHGITVVNSPGTVDAGYRGEIKVTLLNTDRSEPFRVEAGDRIAQLIVTPVSRAVFVPVAQLTESVRGESGFGSTGVRG